MEATASLPSNRRPMALFVAVFAVIVALLVAGYLLFLRTDYVVFAQDLRPEDSAPVVQELEKRGTAYRLSDGGTTILVPEQDADASRVAIAASDVAARGMVGFELFNESDMGLTNFAQKINYQRALQGELARTIMLMEGIESARVHLALPERALFRGDRIEPSAAVTLVMKAGNTADPSRVAGIQRLVAAAVPDLPEAKVVVLDGDGRQVSTGQTSLAAPGEMNERQAIQAYFAARARSAAEPRMAGQEFATRVLLMPIDASGSDSGQTDETWVPRDETSGRNYRLRVLIVSPVTLSSEDQQAVRNLVAEALAFDSARGDALAFETGPVDVATAPPIAVAGSYTAPAPAPAPRYSEAVAPAESPFWWWAVGLAFAGIATVLLVARRRRPPELETEAHDAFAGRLRRQLNLMEPNDAGA